MLNASPPDHGNFLKTHVDKREFPKIITLSGFRIIHDFRDFIPPRVFVFLVSTSMIQQISYEAIVT
jgi:hypothetical protein